MPRDHLGSLLNAAAPINYLPTPTALQQLVCGEQMGDQPQPAVDVLVVLQQDAILQLATLEINFQAAVSNGAARGLWAAAASSTEEPPVGKRAKQVAATDVLDVAQAAGEASVGARAKRPKRTATAAGPADSDGAAAAAVASHEAVAAAAPQRKAGPGRPATSKCLKPLRDSSNAMAAQLSRLQILRSAGLPLDDAADAGAAQYRRSLERRLSVALQLLAERVDGRLLVTASVEDQFCRAALAEMEDVVPLWVAAGGDESAPQLREAAAHVAQLASQRLEKKRSQGRRYRDAAGGVGAEDAADEDGGEEPEVEDGEDGGEDGGEEEGEVEEEEWEEGED